MGCTLRLRRSLMLMPALALALALPAAPPAPAAGPDPAAVPTRLDLHTERVVIFKDGHGLFIKSGTGVVDADGTLFTEQVPPTAVLGTFWAGAAPHAIRSLKAHYVERREVSTTTTDCVTHLELLRANLGRTFTITSVRGESWRGCLADVLEVDPASGAAVSAVLDSAGRQLIVPIQDIRTIEGDGLTTTMTRTLTTTVGAKRLTFQFDPSARGRTVTVQVLYFTPGIRWIPTYRIEGELVDTADVELQGEILNELEDIRGAAIDLVVGVPNFRFADTISPLSLESAMRSALASALPNQNDLRLSNASFANRAGEWEGQYFQAQGGPRDAADIAPELTAAGEQDFFVYSVPAFDLQKGARATIPLWRSRAPLRHVYTADFHIVRDSRSGSTYRGEPPGNPSPLRLARNIVWHQLELTNSGDVPWTTGPAMLLRSFLPLGQELLTYTPIGGCALVPVAVAVDVRATHDEVEIERRANVLKWGGSTWSSIRKRGTVTITNFRDAPIESQVSLSIGGRIMSATGDGKIRLEDVRAEDWEGGFDSANNHSEVQWAIRLAPRQSVTLDYEVEVYVR